MEDQSICAPSCNKYGKNKTLKGQWKWVKKYERQSGTDLFIFLRVIVFIKLQLRWKTEEIQTKKAEEAGEGHDETPERLRAPFAAGVGDI